MCRRMCRRRDELSAVLKPHVLHTWGLAPLWVRSWVVRWDLTLHRKSQEAQA